MGSILLAAAQQAATQLPVPAEFFGLLAFLLLMSLMLALLMFGKGRPHS